MACGQERGKGWVFSTPVRSDNTDDDSDDVSGGGLMWHAGRKEARIGI